MNNKKIYNYEVLKKICKDNSIILSKDYNNEKITRDAIIEGNCSFNGCNEKFQKRFRSIIEYDGGCYCKFHTKENSKVKVKKTCLERFGVETPLQSEIIKEKIKKTMVENYGVENPLQSEIVKAKSKETCLKKYGVEYSLQSQIVREKSKKTMVENYGVENPSQNEEIQNKKKDTIKNKFGDEGLANSIITNKRRTTCLKIYGVENQFQSEIIKEKIKNTMVENYGVENPSQNEEIQNRKIKTNIHKYGYKHPTQNSSYMNELSKNSYKLKDYILPSGEIIKIQGYENYALDELFNNDILEENIITGCKNVPEIWYDDENGKKHRHYVDIFISSQNRCIEIKSTWTAEKKKDCIFLKQKAGKELGYNYEIWVYNGKGEKVECYK
jgi:hypothetical protein